MELPDESIEFINMAPKNEIHNDENWGFGNETGETLKIYTNKIHSENNAKIIFVSPRITISIVYCWQYC